MRGAMMGLAAALTVALLPIAGNVLGTAVAELTRTPRWLIGAALHCAAGVAIALVSVELMPRALETTAVLHVVLPFAAGAAVSVLLFRAFENARDARPGFKRGAWAVYAVTAADLFSDGLMTGASATISTDLSILLGVSQVVANVPGGFATVANMRRHGVGRRARLLGCAALLPPVLASAALGYWVLRGAGQHAQGVALAAIMGILLVSTIEDLVPQADEPGTARWLSTASFAAGFSFLLWLSTHCA